jgi:VanZ family protein
MSNERNTRFWIHAWWPVAVGVALIALESSSRFGTDHTSGPLRWLWQTIFGPVSNARWELIHVTLRKSGHFVGYGVIGLAWLRAWAMSLPRMRLLVDVLLAVLGTAVMASCDEFHQSFLPNRGASPWDVLLDCGGAAIACMLAYMIVRVSRAKQLQLAKQQPARR